MSGAWSKLPVGRINLNLAFLESPSILCTQKRYRFHRFGTLDANTKITRKTRVVRRERDDWPQFPPLDRNPRQLPLNIPKRIPRSSTDVLEALSSTVGRDPTSPGYRFMDDPFFIPVTMGNKRNYALAKESGRRAARYIVQNHPELFHKPFSDPEIPSLQASALKEFKIPSQPTENDIRSCLEKGDINSATSVYRILKQNGAEISEEVRQELLEWLCFFNGENAEFSEFFDEDWYKASLQPEARKRWKKGGAAEEVFNDFVEKTPAAYSAMITGMAKYVSVESARALFDEMEKNNLPISLQVYNEMIRIVPMLQETYESRWELTMNFLDKMRTTGSKPDLKTFNAVLESLSRSGGWRNAKKVALEVMAEMKSLGIAPSLASYSFLLTIFCRDRGPISHILLGILGQVEKDNLELLHPEDSLFFPTAMEVAARHLQDSAAAKRIHALFSRDQNETLITDFTKENAYYGNYFRALLAGESIDGFLAAYEELVPTAFTPDSNLLLEFSRMLEANDRLDLLPRIWDDAVVFGHHLRENFVNGLLEVMLANDKPEIRESFATVAKGIRDRIDNQSEMREQKLPWNGQLVGDLSALILRSGDLESAWNLFQKFSDNRSTIYGIPSQESLKALVDALVETNDLGRLKTCLVLAADLGFVEITERLNEIAQRLSLNSGQVSQLRSLISSTGENVEQV